MSTDLAAIVKAERQRMPDAVLAAPSMMSWDERALLHWAARTAQPTGGALIDAGAFLGGSALALGYGVLARDSRSTELPEIHAYDLFQLTGEQERRWIDDNEFAAVGMSSLAIFEQVIQPVRPLINAHPKDILEETWDETPISVLFLDIAKAWRTGDHLWRTFFPHLVAGESLVIQQDQAHWGHPWTAIIMELLAAHFEFLGWVWYSSVAYRCVSQVALDEIPVSLLHDLDADRKLELLNRFADRLGEPIGGSVRLGGVFVLAAHGRSAEARELIAETASRYSDDDVPFISQGIERCTEMIDQIEAGTYVMQ